MGGPVLEPVPGPRAAGLAAWPHASAAASALDGHGDRTGRQLIHREIPARSERIHRADDTGAEVTQPAILQWEVGEAENTRASPGDSNSSATDDKREQGAHSDGGTARVRLDATWAGGMTLRQTAFNGG